jgi:hypothetical protein
MDRDTLLDLQRRWGAGEYNNAIREQIADALALLVAITAKTETKKKNGQ